MKPYQTIETYIQNRIATVWLNRPEQHNAVNNAMLDELINCFDTLENQKDIRIVLLRGRGKSFCAGADLSRMQESSNLSFDENLNDGYRWANCLQRINSFSIPTIAVATGNVFGGGNGLLCATDIAIAESNAVFSFSEAKLGLAPSTIMPYIISRVNEHKAKYLMFTCQRIDAAEAHKINLVDYAVPTHELEGKISSIVSDILNSSPEAIKEIKELIAGIKKTSTAKDIIDLTAKSIAKLKTSPESREGISAFFENRKPSWS